QRLRPPRRASLRAEARQGVGGGPHAQSIKDDMPVLSRDDAAIWAQARASSARLVFTNGVFDLLHPGHVRYLQAARNEGDTLIVAINSDRSVRGNKGSSRHAAR